MAIIMYMNPLFYLKLLCFILVFACVKSVAQSESLSDTTHAPIDYLLIADMEIQIKATQALNDMYNFKFDKAARGFRSLKYYFPNHPLADFLLGLNEWWKIVPNIAVEDYDVRFLMYMDSSIYKAEKLFKYDSSKVEGAFFLAAAYAFKGRLHSERRSWLKAANAVRQSLKYLDDCRSREDLSPELMFGDGLYNYFSVWLRENYPQLRPFMIMFSKGDKDLGLDQLRTVSRNAFYTRTEAQFWLMRILFNEENDPLGAIQVSEYLHNTFPDNPFFQRYYAMMLFSSGGIMQAKNISEDMLLKIDSGYFGYEATSGRYASFFLARIWESNMDLEKALHYYNRAISFGEESEAYESGYYLYSLMGAARIYHRTGNNKEAREYLKLIRKHAKRKHPAHEQAREFLKTIK